MGRRQSADPWRDPEPRSHIGARGPRGRAPGGRPHAGFTLLEVLVALAVVALALTALVKAASDRAATAAYLRDKTIAHWVAMNRVTQAQIEADSPPLGGSSGSASMGGRQWYWRMRVATTPDADTRRLEVEVRSREDGAVPLARLIAFVSV